MEGVKGMVAAIERHSLLWILSSVLITTFGKLWHVWIAIRWARPNTVHDKKNSCLDHGQGEFMAGDNVCQERIYSIWSNAVPNIDKVVIMINRIHMLLIYIW